MCSFFFLYATSVFPGDPIYHHADLGKAAVKVQDPHHSPRKEPHSCYWWYCKKEADYSLALGWKLLPFQRNVIVWFLSLQNVVDSSPLDATSTDSWVWRTSRNTRVSKCFLDPLEGRRWPKCLVETASPLQPRRVRTWEYVIIFKFYVNVCGSFNFFPEKHCCQLLVHIITCFCSLQTIRSLHGETQETGALGCLLIRGLVQRFALPCQGPSLVPSTMYPTSLAVVGTPLS